MKPFISTAFYGFFKYFSSLFLIASPWVFNLVDISSAALLIPMYFGWLQLIMTIFVDTEASPIRQFPIQMNMVADMVMGFFLFVSPWVYDFADRAHWPELLLGGMLMFLALFTKKSPFLTKAHEAVSDGQLNSRDSNEGRLNV
jgi:hypothetical protein